MMISLRYRLLVVAIAFLVFWPAAAYVERVRLFDVLNGLVVCIGIGIVARYGKTAAAVFRDRACSPAHLLLLAITMSWIAVVLRISMIWIWRLLDRPLRISDHVLLAFPLWVFVLAGALHLTAHDATDEHVPRRNLVTLAVTLVAGITLGIGAAGAY